MHKRALVSTLMLVFLTAPTVLALQGGVTQAPEAIEPPPGEAPGEAVTPLGEEVAERVDHLVEAAQTFRGLSAALDIPITRQNAADLNSSLESALREGLPEEEETRVELALKFFGLLPENADLRSLLQKLLASQVVGYYDPERELLVVQDDHEDASWMKSKLFQELVLVHEIVHFLQDRHFDLERFRGADMLADFDLATKALIEGDASLVMMSYMIDERLERIPFLIKVFEKSFREPGVLALMASSFDIEDLADAPLYFRQNLSFPYLQGMLYCLHLREMGGQPLLDYAFRSDPPTSSEQILHPEKWLVERDTPIEIELAGLDSLFPDMVRSGEGTWGEANIGVILASQSHQKEVGELYASAAAGWGGDRFALWEGPKAEIGVWVTDWDTPGDAQEFERAARTALGDWTVSGRAQRVVLWQARGKVKKAVRRALTKSLIEVPAEHRPAQAPDLAALGITDEDRPSPVSYPELIEIASKLQESGLTFDPAESAEALEILLADPEVAASMLEMLEDMTPADLAALQENPMMKDMIRDVLAQEPIESVLADGVLHLPRMSVELPVPNSEQWTVIEEIPAKVVPRPVLMLQHDSGRFLAIVAVELPGPTLLEAIVAGAKATLESQIGFKKHSGEYTTYSDLRAYELDFSFTQQDVRYRVFQSFFLIDQYMLTLQTFATVEEGPDQAFEDLQSTFSGVRRTESNSQ